MIFFQNDYFRPDVIEEIRTTIDDKSIWGALFKEFPNSELIKAQKNKHNDFFASFSSKGKSILTPITKTKPGSKEDISSNKTGNFKQIYT